MVSRKGGPGGIRVPDVHGRVRSKIRPGGMGTKRLAVDYGDRLVCVRYRYDEGTKRRFKTVEIIVSEAPWNPEPFRMVFVSVEAWETKLRTEILSAGGRWNPKRGKWRLRYNRAVKLGLKSRVVAETPAPRPALQPLGTASATSGTSIAVETRFLLPAEISPLKPG